MVCGDFNEGNKEEERPRFTYMEDQGFLTDGSLIPTRPEYINDTLHGGHVDWIYFKDINNISSVRVEKGSAIGSIKASDHKLIYTDFYFGDNDPIIN